jgi:hypothetical protein
MHALDLCVSYMFKAILDVDPHFNLWPGIMYQFNIPIGSFSSELDEFCLIKVQWSSFLLVIQQVIKKHGSQLVKLCWLTPMTLMVGLIRRFCHCMVCIQVYIYMLPYPMICTKIRMVGCIAHGPIPLINPNSTCHCYVSLYLQKVA